MYGCTLPVCTTKKQHTCVKVQGQTCHQPEKPRSHSTMYFLCCMLGMLSNNASSTRRVVRPRNAITPIAVPNLHALLSSLYKQTPSNQPCADIQPNTIMEKSCKEKMYKNRQRSIYQYSMNS